MNINEVDLDLMTLCNDILNIGMVACFSGYSDSAYELFFSLHKSFFDCHPPVMGMVYAKLCSYKTDEATEILHSNSKLFIGHEDDFKLMQFYIETFKNNSFEAQSILHKLKKSNNPRTKIVISPIVDAM